MTCREFIEFLISYVDGGLTPATRDAFDAHLAVCPDCAAYLRHYVEVIAAAPAAFADDDFAAVPEALVHAILECRR